MPSRAIAGVYAITNIVNGKQYVGSAVHILTRWATHRWGLRRGKHHSPILQAAWDKYGEAAFEFTILEVVTDVALLREREQHWFTVLRPAYICDPDIATPTSRPCSPVARAKITGRKRTPEQVERIRAAVQARGDEWRANVQAAMQSPETREKCRQINLGKPKSEEHKAKLRAFRTGYFPDITDEARERIAAAGRRKHSPELRAKIKATREARGGLTPQAIENIRAAQKARWARYRAAKGEQAECPNTAPLPNIGH